MLKLERIQRISTKIVPVLEDLIDERLKEMNLKKLKERREMEDLITIHKLMKNSEETNLIYF